MEVGLPRKLKAPINWQHRRGRTYWGEISPGEHLVQMYEHEAVLLDTLEAFVSGGLELGEAVILIVTPEHLKAIEERLLARGVDVAAGRANDQYIPLDAATTLGEFMLNGLPDSELFKSLVLGLLTRARGKSWRRVRAFGEMVVLLWKEHNQAGTLQLEHLWQDLCKSERFSLLCAYPLRGFELDVSSIERICAAHSNTIPS
jgi:hypothetical protein